MKTLTGFVGPLEWLIIFSIVILAIYFYLGERFLPNKEEKEEGDSIFKYVKQEFVLLARKFCGWIRGTSCPLDDEKNKKND